jgi:hypothetical protein
MKLDLNQYHKHVLNYGAPGGENLPNMPEDLYFGVGYNDNFGRLDVFEGHGPDGTPVFEGRVDIKDLLARLPERTEATAERNDAIVEEVIMDAYNTSTMLH